MEIFPYPLNNYYFYGNGNSYQTYKNLYFQHSIFYANFGSTSYLPDKVLVDEK